MTYPLKIAWENLLPSVETSKPLYENVWGCCAAVIELGETEDFGIRRIIVQDPYKAICVLKQNGYVCSITPVLAVAVPDEAGSLLNILNILGKNGVNLDYTYAFTMKKKDFAYMVFRVQDNEKAIDVLSKNKIELISQDDLAQM